MSSTLDRSKAPAVSPLPHLSLPRPVSRRLPCGAGLTVLESAVCDAPVFQLRLIAEGAGQYDCTSSAAAALYPIMLNQGSEGLDGDTISDLFEGAGAWFNATLQTHHLDASLKGLCDTAPEIVAAFADMLRRPLFPADRLAVVAESRAMDREVRLSRPMTIAREATAKMLWGDGHPAAVFPSPDDMRRVTPADLQLCHSAYRPEGINIYLSGHVTPELVDTVAGAFDALYPAVTSEMRDDSVHIIPPEPQAGYSVIDMPGSTQAAISVRIPTIMRSHPDYEMLRLAVTGLGGYFGSRLNSNLREERGLTYGITASLVGSLDGAYMSIATECRRDAAEEALGEIRAEIERFVKDPPSGEELSRLLGYSSTRLAGILDSPFTILDTAAVFPRIIGAPADYFDRTQAAIASATPEELARVVSQHLSAPSCIAIAR